MDSQLNKGNLGAFHRAIAQWYTNQGRKTLPWRNTDDPYAIYISEIMLQQTQVKTVLERYYFPFLERFPTLGALAAYQSPLLRDRFRGRRWMRRGFDRLRGRHAVEVAFAALRTPPLAALAARVFFGRGSFPDLDLAALRAPTARAQLGDAAAVPAGADR